MGFLHNISFDFLWDPSALSTDAPYFSNNYIFLVKVLNSTAAVAGAKERPAWGTTNSLMDANGSIDVSKLQENIHYTLGAGSRASCALNGEYFKVIRKFNLAYNQKSLDTNMLPGNTMLHWKVNQPMGNFQIKQSSQRLADMGAASGVNVAHWTNVDYFDIDTDRQYHLLYFTTNNSTTNPAPKLTIRVNYTYTSKET